MTLLGAPPPPLGQPPFAIVPYYLYAIIGKFPVLIPKYLMRPGPKGSTAGLGAIISHETGFLKSKEILFFLAT